MNKSLLLVATLAALVFFAFYGTQEHSQGMPFQQYKALFGIVYESQAQEHYRRRVYEGNLIKIHLHNLNPDRTFDMGVNQFTHLTQEEFESTYLGLIATEASHKKVEEGFVSVGNVDWVAAGAVTHIKNQGSCGSCWAFASTGCLEGLDKIAYNKLDSFSEQQLIDCSDTEGNHGCNGGVMAYAFNHVKAHGITTQAAYPYKGVKESCKTEGGAFKISGHVETPGCTGLANALVGRPMGVGVDARSWSAYKSGIFNNCGTSIDHAVLVVGVTDQYWRIKNSWGTSWGEQGFIRLERGNTCSVCTQPYYPTK